MRVVQLPKAWRQSARAAPKVLPLILGIGILLVLEWLLETRLSTTANASHFATNDGKMAEAVVRTAYQFASFLDLTNLNPLQGFGSQILPTNVWINPVHWPLAFIQGKPAADLAGLIGLICIASAGYFMARCFDLPALPSIVAAQLSLTLFGPVGPLLTFTASFVLLPGMAAVYAPYIAALGLLGRIELGQTKQFFFYSAVIAALILYSVGCDPLWSTVGAASWAVAFAVVALSPLRIKAILLRCTALAISFVLLLGSGVLLYVYTLSRYTARVYFSGMLERPFAASYVSILFSSPYAKYYYAACTLGWLIGLIYAAGRVRVLVIAGTASFIFLFFYALAFVLLDVSWWLPLPFYVEHSLAPLFMVSAVAGYWSAGGWILRSTSLFLDHSVHHPLLRAWGAFLGGLITVLIIPAGAGLFARQHAKSVLPQYYSTPWPREPELAAYLLQSTGLAVGQAYRGSSLFLPDDIASIANLWRRGVPTINEYSQLVSPQASYIEEALLGNGARLNIFTPWIGPGGGYETLFKTLQAMGVRHILHYGPLGPAEERNLPSVTVPRQPRDDTLEAKPGKAPMWQIYELPDPNIGNFSPTEIVVADSAPQIISILKTAEFNFRQRVVLSSGGPSLVPARDMRVTVNRGGGFHIHGKSDGVSLILLPQQFSHCMRASDAKVSIVRADLLWLGIIFSGSIDADLSFAYGIFSPKCRLADIADMKRLEIHLATSAPSTGRHHPQEKLQASFNAFKALR